MRIPLFNFLSKNYDKIIVVLILAIASFFRLYLIADYMTFLGDEGRDVIVVYKILHGDPTFLGPTASVGGFFLGPVYYYFMTPFLWLFNYNPVGPAIMVALFGIATVFLIYKVGKEFFGFPVGLIASFLYAISPLVVIYSRSSWNPNPMPFFSLLIIYLIYKAVLKNSLKLFILSGFILGITIQLHYLAVFLGVIVFAYILLHEIFSFQKGNFIGKIIKVLKQNIYILVGFIVGLSPFLAFEVNKGFPNTVSIFNFIFRSGETGGNIRFFETVKDVFFRLFGRLVVNFPAPEKIPNWDQSNIVFWQYFTIFLGLASISVLILKLIKSYKNKSINTSKLAFILLWLVLGIGLFGFYKKSIYDYYFGLMFPLPFFLVSIFIASLWKSKIGKILGILILSGIIWLNFLTLPFKASANKQLEQMETISKFVISKTENKPFNFALITGGNSDHAYRYFFIVWGKEPITIQNEVIDPKRETATDQLLVVCEIAPDCHPLGNSLWEIAGFGRAEIVDEWDVSVVKVFKLKHYNEKPRL